MSAAGCGCRSVPRELIGVVAAVGAAERRRARTASAALAWLDAGAAVPRRAAGVAALAGALHPRAAGRGAGHRAAGAAAPRRAAGRHPRLGLAADRSRRRPRWSGCARQAAAAGRAAARRRAATKTRSTALRRGLAQRRARAGQARPGRTPCAVPARADAGAERRAAGARRSTPNSRPPSTPCSPRATASRALLLDGVTGSGKTEVYLHAIADCLARGRQALVLVPEIGLTPQTLARFRARLGVPVHALHSGLSDGERARAWAACARGEARVVVGTRSAVFTPLPRRRPDRDRRGARRQLQAAGRHPLPRARLRPGARQGAGRAGRCSAAPRRRWNRCTTRSAGRYAHLRLRAARRRRAAAARARARRAQAPARGRPVAGTARRDRAPRCDAGDQVLVFKNRRGYAPVLLCHDCGWSAQCQRCDCDADDRARRRPPPAMPPLRRAPAGAACLPGLRRPGAAAAGRRHRAHRGSAGASASPTCRVLRIDRGTTQRRDALEQHC